MIEFKEKKEKKNIEDGLCFPFLKSKNVIYLDSAGTSLKPNVVIKSISEFYRKYSLNTHSEVNNKIFRKIDNTVLSLRKAIIKRINGSSYEEIIFVPSATHAFNFLSLSLENILKKGDKILLTHLEHSSNLYPWERLAKKNGAEIKFLDLDEKGYIDIKKLSSLCCDRLSLVSIAHTTNSLGTTNDIKKIIEVIKKKSPNCIVIIDACQSILYETISAKEWDIDCLIFSAHKIYGPTGIGVMWINEKRKEIKSVLWGGGKKISPLEKITNFQVPYYVNWEVGSLPLAQIFGLRSVFEWLEDKNFESKVVALKKYTLSKLASIFWIKVYNKDTKEKNGIITFNVLKSHSQDIADYLGKKNIFVRAGDFCCPYLEKVIGVFSAIRVSLGPYNTKKDIDSFLVALREAKEKLSFFKI